MQPLGSTGEEPGHWTPADRASVLAGLLLVVVAFVWQFREATERKEAFSVEYETVHVRDEVLYYVVVDLANAGKVPAYVRKVGWAAPGSEAAIFSGGELVQPGESVHLVSGAMTWQGVRGLLAPVRKVRIETLRGVHAVVPDAVALRSFMEVHTAARGPSVDSATEETVRRFVERLPFDPVRDSLVQRYGRRGGSPGPLEAGQRLIAEHPPWTRGR